jgi:hypothetical protein
MNVKQKSLILDKIYSCFDFNRTRHEFIENTSQLNQMLRKKLYFTMQFTGAIKMMMFFTKINGTCRGYIINRRFIKANRQYIKQYDSIDIEEMVIPTECHETFPELFDNTLFESRLAFQDGVRVHYIYDVYYLHGKNTMNMDIINKFDLINTICDFFSDNTSYILMPIKLHKLNELGTIMYEKLQHCDPSIKINGLIFVQPITNTHYVYVNEHEITETRNSSENSQALCSYKNFLICKGKIIDVYELFDVNEDGSQTKRIGIAHIPDIKTSHFYRDIFKTKDSTFCKCIYSTKFMQWVPVVENNIEYIDVLCEYVQT